MLFAASTFLGLVLLVILVREVFHQLLYPEGRGFVSVAALRGCRWLARRSGRRAMVFAGPASLAVVLGIWYLLAVVSWALLLLPHMPDGFVFGPGVEQQRPIIDALYVSSVSISTLGFGDIAPLTPAMRFLVPAQSVMGFGLLTASLTWMLSIYQPLARQRTLARQVNRLLRRSSVDEHHLQAITSMVAATTIDLNMTSAIYYFHARDERECLARVAVPLWDLVTRIERRDEHPAREEAAALRTALEELAEVLADDHVPWARGPSVRDVLRAWAIDDHAARSEEALLAETSEAPHERVAAR